MIKVQLPKNKSRLAESIRQAVAAGRTYRNPLSIEWAINYWYLQGVRRFSIVSYKTGRIQRTWESAEGKLNMRYEDTLNKYQRELGRLMRIDTGPTARARSLSLDGERKAAVARVILDELVAPTCPDKIRMNLMEGLLMYGTIGVATWVNKDVSASLEVVTETIPPWELLPLPAKPTRAEDAIGIIRHRSVPLEWLKDQRPDFSFSTKTDAMEVYWVSPGEKKNDNDDVNEGHAAQVTGLPRKDRPRSDTDKEPDDEAQIELVELWIPDTRNRVDRYIAVAGTHVLKDSDFSKMPTEDKPVMPIAIARYNHTGSFWGRSFCGPLIPINMEVEQMLENLFQNVKDLDNYGYTLIPSTWGIRKEHLKATTSPRAIFYEQDYSAPNARIERIQPVNTGDFPGRIASMGNQIMDRLSDESPLFSGNAPGRAESSPALGLLYETSNLSLVAVGVSVAECMAQNYRALLQRAKDLLDGQSLIYMANIDDAVAGIVLDPQTGAMALNDDNPIPDPSEIEIDIKDREPKNLDKRKEELWMLRQAGQIDPNDFEWINYRDQLGFPSGIAGRSVVNAITSCMFRNIVQWNDGKTPKAVDVSPHDKHPIHLMVIEAFMERATFTLASEEVKDYFEDRRNYHESALGGFPDALPRIEEMAGQTPYGTEGTSGQMPPQLQDQLQTADQQPPG